METDTPFPLCLRVGRIRYINSDPVYYHLETHRNGTPMRLVPGPPALLNRLIRTGALDISPVSSVEYARNHTRYAVLPDLSISSSGPVRSVLLLSRVPKERLHGHRIWVSEESETSRELVKLLIEEETGTCPEILSMPGDQHFLETERPTAAVIIGDPALHAGVERRLPFQYDLGEWWRARTGLGFVFALWVVRREVVSAHPRHVRAVHQALIRSKRKSRQVLSLVSQHAARRSGLDSSMVQEYLRGLRFDLSPDLLDGLRTFYEKLFAHGHLPGPVPLRCMC